MSRRVAREELFKLVFESELKEESTKEVLDNYLKRDEVLTNENELAFIKKYMNGIAENNDRILETINNNITGWSFERIGNVEKALLRCSVYELLCEATPHEIVVNEVVELAKLYGDEKTSEFVNGVLAKIINK
ncbi:transcription antitermination factor NusB [Fusobacterium sp. FSA-380-WT-2B]|uniref:transcription antitermination factor NusB n=1 Tax=Fusobacterium sp. FSA-380-WT-2B TaxID=2605786 RepID=UPI0012B40D38|nr:transcription antitermination factor NusB [Fusobacterium sp. FSA-380-WT-2B]MSS61568.1 transcription antitermination factor NusB [Fusobacterium sp. FSA-380-WT-2B]